MAKPTRKVTRKATSRHNRRIPWPGKTPPLPNANLVILLQPDSQLIESGNPVTFSVIVAGYPARDAADLTYEWQFNKAPLAKPTAKPATKLWFEVEFSDKGFEPHPESQNAPSFTIQEVSKEDVAFYRVKVTAPGGKKVYSEPAQLWVWEETNSIIVYGTVYTQQGGSSSGCPGPYQKRVDLPSGFWCDQAPYKARDDQRNDTWIKWWDYYNAGSGCGPVSPSTRELDVAVADDTLPHYFSIYIPTPPAAATPYQVYLQGFF